MHLEDESKSVDWIQLADNRVQGRAFENMVINAPNI
jgi:hypothetical protein